MEGHQLQMIVDHITKAGLFQEYRWSATQNSYMTYTSHLIDSVVNINVQSVRNCSLFQAAKNQTSLYIFVHKMWIQAAMNMKHAVKDSWFPTVSEHINISKLRCGQKWLLFWSNPFTYSRIEDICIYIYAYCSCQSSWSACLVVCKLSYIAFLCQDSCIRLATSSNICVPMMKWWLHIQVCSFEDQ